MSTDTSAPPFSGTIFNDIDDLADSFMRLLRSADARAEYSKRAPEHRPAIGLSPPHRNTVPDGQNRKRWSLESQWGS